MKVVAPKPFTYKGGEKAVLLLHGFTGSAIDVRKLGKYLQQRGYTCHAPLYTGHGIGPEQLIQSGPDDWWHDVISGYQHLKEEGFKEIAVAGVSLGAVFSLKLATELPVKALVSMCAPMQAKSIDDLSKRVHQYAKNYKKFEGKEMDQIKKEMDHFSKLPMPSLNDLQEIIIQVSKKLDSITSPAFILQGKLDEDLYIASAEFIYNQINSVDKHLKWYEQSGHIITLGEEREKVFEDVYRFLDSLEW